MLFLLDVFSKYVFNYNMKKISVKKNKLSVREKYYEEVIVKPAKRLLDALLEPKKKKTSSKKRTTLQSR